MRSRLTALSALFALVVGTITPSNVAADSAGYIFNQNYPSNNPTYLRGQCVSPLPTTVPQYVVTKIAGGCPSGSPTVAPTVVPSGSPTSTPTNAPTSAPNGPSNVSGSGFTSYYNCGFPPAAPLTSGSSLANCPVSLVQLANGTANFPLPYPIAAVFASQVDASGNFIGETQTSSAFTLRSYVPSTGAFASNDNNTIQLLIFGVGTASNPNATPTSAPTNAPTSPPTNAPTNAPTNQPTTPPTNAPTNTPTNQPTTPPTNPPTIAPATPSPSPVAVAPTQLTFLSPTAGSQNVAISYGTAPYTPTNPNPSIASGSITGSTMVVSPGGTAGQTTITVTGSRGTQATVQVTVNAAATAPPTNPPTAPPSASPSPSPITLGVSSLTFQNPSSSGQAFVVSGGTPPYTSPCATSPVGFVTCIISSNTATVTPVSGTQGASGSVTISDGTRTASVPFSVGSPTPSPVPSIVASPNSLAFSGPGASGQSITLSGGAPPYTTPAVTSPTGLLNATVSGNTATVTPIAGTNGGSGTITFSDGTRTTTVTFSITAPPVTVAPSSLTFANSTSPTQNIQAAGGNGGPYTCVSSNTTYGTCPSGSQASGRFTISPNAAGSFNLTISDSASPAHTATVPVTVESYSAYDQQVIADQSSMNAAANPAATNGTEFFWRLGAGPSIANDSATASTDPLNFTGTYSNTGVLYKQTPGPGDGLTWPQFDGASGNVLSTTTTTLSNSAPFSLEGWVRTSSPGTAGGTIFAFVGGGTRAVWFDDTGHLNAYILAGSAYTLKSIGTFNDATVHHVVFTVAAPSTGSAYTLTLYADGQPVATTATTTTLQAISGSWDAAYSSTISALTGGPANPYFSGNIGKIAVYPGALTAAQVSNHYQLMTGNAPAPAATVGPATATVVTNTSTASPATVNLSSTPIFQEYGPAGSANPITNAPPVSPIPTPIPYGIGTGTPAPAPSAGSLATFTATSGLQNGAAVSNTSNQGGLYLPTGPTSGRGLQWQNLPLDTTVRTYTWTFEYRCAAIKLYLKDANVGINTSQVSPVDASNVPKTGTISMQLAGGSRETLLAQLFVNSITTSNSCPATYDGSEYLSVQSLQITPSFVSGPGASPAPTLAPVGAPPAANAFASTQTTFSFNGPSTTAQKATLSGGTTPYTVVSTSNSGVATASISGSQLTVTPGATVGSSTIVLRDSANTNTVTLTATVNPTPIVLANPSMSFAGPTSGTQTSAVSGGVAPYTVSSSSSAIATASVSGSTITVTPKGTGSTTILVNDANADTAQQTISVTVGNAAPVSNVNFTTEPAYQSDTLAGIPSVNVRKNQTMSGDTSFIEQALLTMGVRQVKSFDSTYSGVDLGFVAYLHSHNIGTMFAFGVCDTDATLAQDVTKYGPSSSYGATIFTSPNEPDHYPASSWDCTGQGTNVNYGSWQGYFTNRMPQVYSDIKTANPLILVDGPDFAGPVEDYGQAGTTYSDGDHGIGVGSIIGQEFDIIDNHDYSRDYPNGGAHMGCKSTGGPDSYICYDALSNSNCASTRQPLQAGPGANCHIGTGENGSNDYQDNTGTMQSNGTVTGGTYSDPVNIVARYAVRSVAFRIYEGWDSYVSWYQFCDGSTKYIGGGMIKNGCSNTNGTYSTGGNIGGSTGAAGQGEIPKPVYYAYKTWIGELADPGANFNPGNCSFNLTAASGSSMSLIDDVCSKQRTGLVQHQIWHATTSEGAGSTNSTAVPQPQAPIITNPIQNIVYTIPASCAATTMTVKTQDETSLTTWANGYTTTTQNFTTNADNTKSTTLGISDAVQFFEYNCGSATSQVHPGAKPADVAYLNARAS